MHNRRVFVSGGAGVIGTALVQSLLKLGADVFVGDLKPCPKSWLGKVKYRQGDLNTIAREDLLTFDPEFFFHLAATFERTKESFPFFEENFHNNATLSHYLINCLKTAASLERVIFASSYLIYDPHLYQFDAPQSQPTVLTEESAIFPRNLCGSAKLFHEQELHFLDHFLQEKLSCVSARIFRVYGRGSRDIISRWIRAALQHETLTVYGEEGKFDYLFADDVAEGLLRLAQTHARGVVNLGSGKSRSIADVLQILHQHFPDLKTKKIEALLSYESSQASIEKLKTLTGWQPAYSLEEGMAQLVNFEKQHLQSQEGPADNFAVLITSISKKIPLLEAVRTASHKIGQFQILHGCDTNNSCVGQYSVDEFWHCPVLKNLKIIQVVHYCEKNKIKAIIPTRDEDLLFYACYRDFLEKKGIHCLVSSLETIGTCQDKKIFSDELIKHNFPAIPTYLNINELKATHYVVKEKYGAGSQQIGLNLTQEQALAHSQKLMEPIFQPYIEGQEWSVDLYRSLEGRVKGCVARQRNYVVEGESQVTTTASYPALEKLCQALADHLKLYGHAVFQVIEDKEGKLHVIECNPRFGGASTASLAVGLDSFYWFFAECLGLSLQNYPFLRREGEIRQIRYVTDRITPWLSYSI